VQTTLVLCPDLLPLHQNGAVEAHIEGLELGCACSRWELHARLAHTFPSRFVSHESDSHVDRDVGTFFRIHMHTHSHSDEPHTFRTFIRTHRHTHTLLIAMEEEEGETPGEDDAPTRKKARTSTQKKQEKDAAATVAVARVDVDFKKLQVIQMGAGAVVKEPWLGVLDEVVVRMSRLTMLVSRFLAFYIARVLSSDDAHVFPLPIPSADSIFQKEFFEHLFKAATCDTSVAFEPTLQFVRCVWLHALLLSHGVADLEPLDEARLWEEIHAQADSKARAKKEKKPSKAGKKRTREEEEEDDSDIEEEGTRTKKSKSLSGAAAATAKTTRTPLTSGIVKHPALGGLLPSCAQVDQCIKYASVAYRTAFVQYQTTGLRAHFGWLLFAKYRLSKKEVRIWLETHFPEQLIDQEEAEQEEQEGPAAALATDVDMDMDAADGAGESDAPMNGDRRAVFGESESKLQATRLSACLLVKKPKERLLQVVRLHHSILQEIERINTAAHALVATAASSSTAASNVQSRPLKAQEAKQFALAPLSKWHRRFVRFDTKALNLLLKHPLYTQTSEKEKKKIAIASTSDIFEGKRIHLATKEKRGVTLAPTFTTDGVQLHLAWQKIVTLSCQLDPKKRAAYEAKEKQKAEAPSLSSNGQVDKRTLKKVIPTLAGSDGPRFWKKTTRLEEHDYGIFQTSSLLASRNIRTEASTPRGQSYRAAGSGTAEGRQHRGVGQCHVCHVDEGLASHTHWSSGQGAGENASHRSGG
jgi:hypothetical protein